MTRILLLCGLISFALITDHNKPAPFPDIAKTFPLHWKVKMGIGSYRTNVVLQDDNIYIGSNGEQFMDWYLYDPTSGVYVINRKNGKIQKHIGDYKIGDMDVNGVLYYQGKVYFGNDNEEFICMTPEGKVKWQKLASGDIEHQPVLIKIGDKDRIVYAAESGEITAVDPQTGETIWKYYDPNFSGWKEPENRFAFKVKAYFSSGRSFFNKPELIDLNRDGIMDLVYLTYSGRIYAINGKNGKLIWNLDDKNSNYYSTIVKGGTKDNPFLVAFASFYIDENYIPCQLLILGPDGKTKNQYNMKSDDWYPIALNTGKSVDGSIIHATADTMIFIDNQGALRTFPIGKFYKGKLSYHDDSTMINRVFRSSSIAENTFPYGKENNCALILYEDDNANPEKGFIDIISLDKQRILASFQLPTRAEMQPVVEDINLDGKLDLLISGYDGYLYCYNLGVPVSNSKQKN